ncbi:hypothetical protein [Nostoc sp. LEGE 12450]|uniref:hypothetical protein n=1 Tax=Nostoc sp. LEGE 12450 TaxID=1828643 RepID=UPI001882B3AD|nr:hypothetical protein [Nostoc sp. LEGE 12450]MBE8990355.1 hypothetical protein [Nostoc sp. LEGE 12450]
MSHKIMPFFQENELFSQMSNEEAATVSGGSTVFGSLTSIAALGGGATVFRAPNVQAAIFANALNPNFA